MNSWLLAYTGPEGNGGYAVIETDTVLDAIRQFRLWFGYAFTLQSVMPAP